MHLDHNLDQLGSIPWKTTRNRSKMIATLTFEGL